MTREEFRRLLRTVANGWNVIIGAVVPGRVGKASGSNSTVQELGGVFGVAIPVPEVTITKTRHWSPARAQTTSKNAKRTLREANAMPEQGRIL